MNTVYQFHGRGFLPPTKPSKPLVIQADPGTVYWVVGHAQPRTNIAFTRLIIFDNWGVFIANPFRRCDDYYNRQTLAEYLPKDLFIYHEVHIYTVPEEQWMLREAE